MSNRMKKSTINTIVAFILNLLTMILAFVTQTFFIKILGQEYLGIHGLFNNIISILGIVELGIGAAIVFNLYKPLAENNTELIKSLMNVYKKCYILIASVITFIGLLILPFLNIIIGEISIRENIQFIFILYLVDVVISYMLTYKRSIMYADQKNYIINAIHILYIILLNLLQIITLIFTNDFILYVFIRIICRSVESLIIIYVSNKYYPYLKEKNVEKLDGHYIKEIFIKVKGLIFHNIGGFIIFGTDNIIISMTKGLGIISVGLYSNYSMIIQAVSGFFTQIFSSITSSVGNLLIENNAQKSYNTYMNMLFINSLLASNAAICILTLIQPFIMIWIGDEFLLSIEVVFVLVINFYIQRMRKTCNTFKEAAGIFYEDRYVPLFEASINIISSIILVQFMGLSGVFIGTIFSSLVLFLYSYPKFVAKKLFDINFSKYIKPYICYGFVTIMTMIISYYITSIININIIILQMFFNIIISIIVVNMFYFICFRKTEEFNYFKNLVVNLMLRRNK